MKKLLRISGSATLVLFFSLTVLTVKAAQPLDYYKQVFIDWSFPVVSFTDIKQPDDTESTIAADDLSKLSQEGTSINKMLPAQDGFLLMLASQSDQNIPSYKNIIIICDTNEPLTLPISMPCTTNTRAGVNYLDLNSFGQLPLDLLSSVVIPVSNQNIDYYLIPQVLLTTPRYQNLLGDYFTAILKANSLSEGDQTTRGDTGIIYKLKTYGSSPLFTLLFYGIAILITASVTRKMLVMAVSDPGRFFKPDFYISLVDKASGFVEKFYVFILITFLFLILLYIPILFFIKLRVETAGTDSSTIKYIVETLDNSNYPGYIESKNINRLILAFYHYVLVLFGFLLIVPNLWTMFMSSVRNFANSKISIPFIKWSIPAIVITDLLLLAFYDLGSTVPLIIPISLSLPVLMLIIIRAKMQKVDYPGLFSKKEIVISVSVILVVFAIKISVRPYLTTQPVRYVYEPLIGIKDDVIVFPYRKSWGKNILFEPYLYKGRSKVFADGYLIYAPGSNKIANKPLENYVPVENSIIVTKDLSNVAKAVLKNPQVGAYISSDTSSPLIIVDNSTTNLSNQFVAEVIFNCSLVPPPASVTLEVLNVPAHSKSIKKTPLKILNFPGCTPDDGQKGFEIPVERGSIPSETVMLNITGIDSKYLADFKLRNNSRELSVNFLNKDSVGDKYALMDASSPELNEITVFSSQVSQDTLFAYPSSENGFDLSVPINELIKSGKLSNPFIIWTDSKNELIQKQ